mgnify:CR=1 FL=1
MDNAIDSRITAHLLSTSHYVAACNALLLALSSKYGMVCGATHLGGGFAVYPHPYSLRPPRVPRLCRQPLLS